MGNDDYIKNLLDFDRKHIWHPYTSIDYPLPVLPVESAQGNTITLMDGRNLVDGMSSWWSAIHGYNNPVINEAINKQVGKLAHIMFGGLTHQPAVELSKLLIELSPDPLDRVFLSDSGSVAVEVAMKMAIQYQNALAKPKKNRFITILGGYHGDTFHAMSVCDPVAGMHHLYNEVLPQYHFADKPGVGFYQRWNDSDLDSLREMVKKHHDEVCGLILEPIVQGAGGMWFYHPEYLKGAKELCSEYGILLIADEIATGLGRTGQLFGCNHAAVTPDIMCLGKTLTGGYMTLGATLTSSEIGSVISEGEPGVFMHGPTYMGNPLACSAAIASIRLLCASDWQNNIAIIERHFKSELTTCKDLEWVNDVRVLGAIAVVELKRNVDQEKIQSALVKQGIWVRPFGKLVYLMPPYTINQNEMEMLTEGVKTVLQDEINWT